MKEYMHETVTDKKGKDWTSKAGVCGEGEESLVMAIPLEDVYEGNEASEITDW